MPALTSTSRDRRVAQRVNVRGATWKGLDQAQVMGVELIAAIGTWAGAGYLLDRWLGTTPWLLALGALVGNAAGIYLIWLRSGRMAVEDERARRAHWNADAGVADVEDDGGR